MPYAPSSYIQLVAILLGGGAEVAVDGVSEDDGGGQGDDAEHHEAVEEVALQLLPPWSAKDLLIRLFYPMLV